MMAAWMAYAALVGAFLVAGAWAVERCARLYRLPTRFGWTAALLAALLIPVAGLVLPGGLASTGGPGVMMDGPVAAVSVAIEGLETSTTGAGLDLNGLLGAGWILATALLLIRIVTARSEMSADLARAARRRIGRARLYLTSGLGPAVTGLGGGGLVLPRWLWRLSPRERRLVLRHEREHLEAGDPWLLAGARLLVTLLPWNLPLWWGLRRLRLAVETDCDRRVLQGGVNPRVYGDLLLRVGERSVRVPGLAALAERPSFLERRIDEMTRPDSKHRAPKAIVTGALAAAAVFVACEAPAPGAEDSGDVTEEVAAPSVQAETEADGPAMIPRDVEPRLVNVDEVTETLQAVYPEDLSDEGVGGEVVLWLYVGTDGSISDVRVHESSGVEDLDEAAEEVAASMEFEPATHEGSPKAVWIQQPINFRAP
ncbi:MAG: TonB family protein [Gemmatimonadota bacterium]